jgi:hypothetical protein
VWLVSDTDPLWDGLEAPGAVAGCGATLAAGEELGAAVEPWSPDELEPAGPDGVDAWLSAGDDDEPGDDWEDAGGTVACCGATVASAELESLLGALPWI